MRTRAKWSRWGWGGGEGYGLEIGNTFRCGVVKSPGKDDQSPSYLASINTHELTRHADRDAAMDAVERELEDRMRGVLADWTIYSALKALNGGKSPREGLHGKRRR